MNIGKRILLNLYCLASQPARRSYRCRAAAAGKLPVAVLFYHRIADDGANPWTASTRTFERQIAWLKSHFDLVSLEEAQRRIRSGFNDRPTASITFDDGYADNCRDAIPLLIRERIPCTYFVTLANAASGEPFPHDLAMGNRLLPNTPEQLRAMADAGIEIGGHTRSHADLGAVDDSRMQDEVIAATHELEGLIGRRVRYFAFPFGRYENLSATAFTLARHYGMEGVCSAYGGFNFPGDDAFHLQRIGVNDDLIGLKNWMTFDPRKLHIPRFEAPVAPEAAEAVLGK